MKNEMNLKCDRCGEITANIRFKFNGWRSGFLCGKCFVKGFKE